jgi:tripartite-type tricarboxylate transporter receptor subunit TctC
MFSVLTFVSAFIAVLCLGPGARAQDYPARSVRIVVPFAAGGPADIYVRVLGQHLGEALKQSFVVDNRPGAGSIIGTQEVAKAAPDGYTLLMMSNTHTVNETLVAEKSFKLTRDFVAVAPVNASDLVLVVHPSIPAKTLAELIADAKARPGKLNYASSGIGTPYHMAGELLKSMTGTDILHVPFKGSSGARNDVLSGQVNMMFDAVTTMTGNVQAGQVRALATSGKSRSTTLPDVPTIAEAGVPGYEATIWLGLMAPAGTPAPIVERLNGEIGRIASRPDIKAAWQKQGAEPMVMSPGAFTAYIEADIEKWGRIIKAAAIKPE